MVRTQGPVIQALVVTVVAFGRGLPRWPAAIRPPPPPFSVRVVRAVTGDVLVRPGVLAEEDVGVLEALEKDLKAAGLRGQGLLPAVEVVALPEGVVKSLGREVDDIGERDNVGAELAVEGVCGGLAYIGEVGNKAEGRLAP